jgi:hypothetical protein
VGSTGRWRGARGPVFIFFKDQASLAGASGATSEAMQMEA